VELSKLDEDIIHSLFYSKTIKRKEFLLVEGKVSDFIAFVNSGIVRHYYIKDGNEITCDIAIPYVFTTDLKSFTQNIPSITNIQALKDTELLIINRNDLLQLYENNKPFQQLGRIIMEKVAQEMMDIAMSLNTDTPEERVNKLIAQRPELLQLVPQKYIASMLGMSPESLSRIRGRKSKF
jgi:CRP-like cAMP-binding protein